MKQLEDLERGLSPIYHNSYAVKLALDYFYVTQIWDDLIDRDVELDDSEIHKAFRVAFIDIPANPFFIDNVQLFIPIMDLVISKWQVANGYESACRELPKAYMLRAGLYDIFAIIYKILKGPDVDCTPIYSLYGEQYKNYKKEIKCQIQ